MPRIIPASGPPSARLMVVGEAPGADEEIIGKPFVGVSGAELSKMLGEIGLRGGVSQWDSRINKYAMNWEASDVFVTNVMRWHPPQDNIGAFITDVKKNVTEIHSKFHDRWALPPIIQGALELADEIIKVRPKVIVALGNVSMLALTGKWGITHWRGSMLYSYLGGIKTKVIPTYHPAAVLRQWSWRNAAVHDLRRARKFLDVDYPQPDWTFIVRPTFQKVLDTFCRILDLLDRGPHRLSFDIETRAGHIACAGISWSLQDAICIPFMCVERRSGFWSAEEESYIIHCLYLILRHQNARVVGQNILYDCQYTWRHWCFVPRVYQDTMISQHAIFSDQPKALFYQASMYCNYYVYWKDEGKDWARNMGEDQLWTYNCQDCVYTDEGGLTEQSMIDGGLGGRWSKLKEVHAAQQKLFWPVLKAMQRGVLVDQVKRDELILEVEHEVHRRQDFLKSILGHPLNPNSPKQMHTLFYQDLRLPVQFTKAKKGIPARPTLNDDAMQKLVIREPLIKPIVSAIADLRTMGIFLSSFLRKPLDEDGRMRCSYNIGGSASGESAPKTYRLSSSENAFGSGGNLQNIPSEKSKSLGKAKARGAIAGLGDPYDYPNIRSMFVPDQGYVFFDGDLDRADLQVVAWEANDALLKAALRMGADIHLLNAFVLVNQDPPPIEELVEAHPRYWTHRRPLSSIREFAKVFCHGTNYGGGARTMAANTGRTVHEIDRAQKIWFGAHPGIKSWQDRIKAQVLKHRFVENRFGYRWYIFDRIDSIIPEAIAWIPQSTVSNVINKIWVNIHENLPEVEVLMQVHDSLAGQFPIGTADASARIKAQSQIVIPYEDPLIIPFGLKTSEISWGECR